MAPVYSRNPVDSRSGRLGTQEVPFLDEEVIQLNTAYMSVPMSLGEVTLYGYYVNEIAAFVDGFSAKERAAYHDLKNDIMTGIEVDVH